MTKENKDSAISKEFTKVCRENGLIKKYVLKQLMEEFIQKHSQNDKDCEANNNNLSLKDRKEAFNKK